mmetsp:Transcript_127953/g.368650  ORF Transcript_127953/g.368650 Transcript_127953/m.368650 type:complete len:200 (-) Transcript_127953:143-742(-)
MMCKQDSTPMHHHGNRSVPRKGNMPQQKAKLNVRNPHGEESGQHAMSPCAPLRVSQHRSQVKRPSKQCGCAAGGQVAGGPCNMSFAGNIAAAWRRSLVIPQHIGNLTSPNQQLISPTGMALVSQHRSQGNSWSKHPGSAMLGHACATICTTARVVANHQIALAATTVSQRHRRRPRAAATRSPPLPHLTAGHRCAARLE